MALLALLCAVSACSSSSGNSASDGSDTAAPTVTPVPPTVVTPPPAQTPSSAPFDTSIGVGVDAYGFADLPLHSGAHRYFVNSASGADGNGCAGAQQPGTPFRTIAAAAACIQGGSGDQVLVAEGTSYSEGLPNLDTRSGFSPQYPTVLESYDPADALNEGKYGRATNGRRPVINTGAHNQVITCCALAPAQFLAIRGFDINPGNVPDMNIGFTGSNGLSNSYVLIENNIFRYTMLGIVQDPNHKGVNFVIRKNAIYGSWSPTAHAQGIYISRVTGFTIEDNVFWHTGWKIGASRDADPSVGGPTMFRHSVYQQDDADGTIRRNIFLDPSATGCSCRSNTTISENVFIDNPISIIAGEGNNYDLAQPNGVQIEVAYNAILGDADINSSMPRGAAIQTGNGKLGSSVHHNLIARSRNPNAGAWVTAFNTQAGYNQPSYAYIHDNLEYLWSAPGNVAVKTGSFLGQDLPTYDNNAWSDAASGPNVNVSSKSLPNPYTSAQLFAALGCTDKTTCAATMIETPEGGWAQKARAILWQGYAMP